MRIAVLPGDGIGPEIVEATLCILERANSVFRLRLDFERLDVGMSAHRRTGTTLPDQTFEHTKTADGIILGPAGVTAYPPASQGGLNGRALYASDWTSMPTSARYGRDTSCRAPSQAWTA